MTDSAVRPALRARPAVVVTMLGLTQILAWGSSYYLLAVLTKPIVEETGWPLTWVVGGLSLGLLMAGLVSPVVGNGIQKRGGRLVLSVSAVLLAAGLAGLAIAPSLPVYILAWLVLGLGMGAGLYDAAFATLGRLYGQSARRAIVALTLFGGLASTVCWPLSAMMVADLGWRGACLMYAAVHLCVTLPIYILGVPREPARPASNKMESHPVGNLVPAGAMLLFCVTAAAITINSMISTVVSVHLLTILRDRDIALAAAVALGAIVGPSQVGARAIEMAISRYHHPIWTMVASAAFVAVGVGILWAGLPFVAAALVFYGAGIGIESIARGTLPLALFGDRHYAVLMGRIAMPSLIVQALSPLVGAFLLQQFGTNATLASIFGAAVLDLVLAIALFACLPRKGSGPVDSLQKQEARRASP